MASQADNHSWSALLDQATSTILAAAIGAFAGIGGGVILEAFKRRQERRGVAFALAGVVEFQIWAIEYRGHIEMFRAELACIEAGEVRTFFGLVDKGQVRDLIADAYIEKYGILGGTLPARIIAFLQTMWALRVDVSRVVAGDFKDQAVLAKVVREDIKLAEQTIASGKVLAHDLRASAEWPFATVLKIWRYMTTPAT